MSPTTRTRLPFGGKRRLYDIIKVRLPNQVHPVEYDLNNTYVEGGIPVLVETRRGPILARTSGERYRKVLPEGSLRAIIRVADARDIKRDADNRYLEEKATAAALKHIKRLRLDMKLISVETLHDRSRTVFYFSADGRVDFRQLVRSLAREIRGRVEMHQIGVRNGAGIAGGIGSCGRELCCSTFLNDFEPVAIRMVKDQGLTLNPKKVSGMCGRLMCCLVYEHSAYVRGRKEMPRRNTRVVTRTGPGKVIGHDIVQETLTVLHDDGVLETWPIIEVYIGEREFKPRPTKPSPYTIDGPVPPDISDDGGSGKKRRRRRSRSSKSDDNKDGKRRRGRGSKSSRSDDNTGGGGKRRRRRRRSKSSKSSRSDGGGQQQSSSTSSSSSRSDDGNKSDGKRRRRRRRRSRSSKGGGNSGGSRSSKGGGNSGGSRSSKGGGGGNSGGSSSNEG